MRERKGAIRKVRTQEGYAFKSKLAGEKDEQRRMTEERDTKTENTFSVLQEEDTELLLEENEPPQFTKYIRTKIKEREREEVEQEKPKAEESEMGPKSGVSRNNFNEGAQIKKSGLMSANCENDCYLYKTKKA